MDVSVVAKAVYSRLPLKLHDWRPSITRGWTRVVCAFCMEEGTIWAYRFTFSSNQNVFCLPLYSL